MRYLRLILFVLVLTVSCKDSNQTKATTSKKKILRWHLASSFPNSLPSFSKTVGSLANDLNFLSQGEINIKTYQPGELIPALEVFDAVSNGSIELGVSAGAYYLGKNKVFLLEAGFPFGLTARQQNAWLYEYGGLDLVQEVYKKYNIYYLPIGNTGTQMGGWFKREVNSLKDLQGMRVRAAGMAGEIYSRLGATVQMVSGGEIYSSLEQGTIDAAEFIGPFDDEKFGFYETAKYYYAPGWGEPGTSIALYINLEKWNELTPELQKLISTKAKASNLSMLAKYDVENSLALSRLKKKGVEVKFFSDEILRKAYIESRKILDEYSEDPTFKKILESIEQFKKQSDDWDFSNELRLKNFYK